MRAHIIAVAVVLSACGGDDDNGSNSNYGGSGHVANMDGGAGAGGSQSAGSSAAAGSGGSGGGGPGGASNTNTACPMVRQLVMQCGITIPDKPCKDDAQCSDSCTLMATCDELRDLARGVVDAKIMTCFDSCK